MNEKDSSKSNIVSNARVENAASNEVMEIDLLDLGMHFLEKWRIFAIAAVVGICIFGFYTLAIAKPVYEATAKLYVLNNKDSAVNLSDLQLSSYLANDYSEVFSNWHVHEMVRERLGLDYSYAKMNGMVSVNNPSNTRILYITVASNTPEEAQALANTYAEVAQEFIAVKMDTAEPSIFEEALLPTSKSSPSLTKNLIMGFILGLVVAAACITIQYMLDDYIRTAEDVDKYIHIPVLGDIMLQNEAYHMTQRPKTRKE